MKNNHLNSWLKKFFIVTITVGIIFRIFTLNYFFWHDEIWTLLRVSGYTMAELAQEITQSEDQRFFDVPTLKKYQTLKNNKHLSDTLDSLIKEDAHLSPLDFILTRFWMKWFGDSIFITRLLPLLFSLITLPCIYWLCLELFQSKLTGWIAMAMVAVSPVHIFFSTYVRFYSLSTLTILIFCITLLRAMRLNNKMSWILYAVSLAISLYTFLFSGLVAIGNLIFVLLMERFKVSKKLIAYIVSSSVAVLCFLPWLSIITKSSSSIGNDLSWLVQDSTIQSRILSWLHSFSVIFFDVSNNLRNDVVLEKILFIKLPDLISFSLAVYSFYYLAVNSSFRACVFVFTLAGSTALILILLDIPSGTITSFSPRYLLPSLVGIQLSVAYLISHQIGNVSTKNQKYGYIILIGVLLSSILSSSILVSQGPWQGSLSLGHLTPSDLRERSQIIDQSKLPVLFGNPSSESLLSISCQISPSVKILLASKKSPVSSLNKAFAKSDNVFLYDSSLSLEKTLTEQKNIKVVPIYSRGNRIILKKIEKQ